MRTIMLISAAITMSGCDNASGGNNLVSETVANANQVVPEPDFSSQAGAPDAQDYVAGAGAGDRYEIEASRLAIEKAEHPEIKELARMILADHERSTAALTRAARAVEPPVRLVPELDAEKRANLDALRSATGAAFDSEYLRQQVAAHEQALALVEGYARDGENPQLREHATTVSGPIRQHLERARALAGSTGPGR